MLDHIVLEAPDHDLVLEQQVQLVRVLAAAEERHAVNDPALRRLPSSAPSVQRIFSVKAKISRAHVVRS